MREEVNGMIHAWMTNDKDDFYACLQRVRTIVSKPLLTEEEYGLMQMKEEWIRIRGPEGKPVYTKRDGTKEQLQQEFKAPVDDEESDDEVIDVAPARPAARPAASR